MVFISKSGSAINLDMVHWLRRVETSRTLRDQETGDPIFNSNGPVKKTYFEVWAGFGPDDNEIYIDEFETEKEAINFIRWLATKIEPCKNPPPVNYDEYLKWLNKEAEKNGILIN